MDSGSVKTDARLTVAGGEQVAIAHALDALNSAGASLQMN